MNTNELINEKVHSEAFGEGVITSVDETAITIKFDKVGDKIFRYPKSFSRITFYNDELNVVVQKDIENDAMQQEKEKIEKRAKLMEVVKEKQDDDRLEEIINGNEFSSHHEVLNTCFGFNYKMFRSAYKAIDENYAVWFPHIAREVEGQYVSTDETSGWINISKDGGKEIIQMDHHTIPTDSPEEVDMRKRLIFIATDSGKYEFIGVYDSPKRVDGGYMFRRISTKFNCKDMTII